MPPSDIARPETEWPPPRTAGAMPLSRATFTAMTTSSTLAGRRITSGCLSIMPFQSRRAVSYSASPGLITSPRKPPSCARMLP